MPHNVKPQHCQECSFGYCIKYIREQSKKMKDRDTQYRLMQNIAMACAFDEWLPGEKNCPFPASKPIDDYLEQLILNARNAGATIERMPSKPFGKTEKKFFLTEAQIGKVRGDTFETICRSLIWNHCARFNAKRTKGAPIIAVVSLGDNYDLRKLFTPESGRKLTDFIEALAKKDVSLSYSTPDLVMLDISNLPGGAHDHFRKSIVNLSLANQKWLNDSRNVVAGLLTPADVLFACGLKTSIRSDRMFQFLFEANAWKFIWRRVFSVPASPYHSLTSQIFGADPSRLRSIDFSDLGNAETATRAIDSLTQIVSPVDVEKWFEVSLQAALSQRTEGVAVESGRRRSPQPHP